MGIYYPDHHNLKNFTIIYKFIQDVRLFMKLGKSLTNSRFSLLTKTYYYLLFHN
jgi:hypothetical protein